MRNQRRLMGQGKSDEQPPYEELTYNSLKASSKLSESDWLHEEKDESDVTFPSTLAMNVSIRCNLLDSSASSSSLLFMLSWLYEPSSDVSSSSLRALRLALIPLVAQLASPEGG
ncbi:hypothetical protein Taro_045717 [Colocasia esculenta]|uniref:Uncharacterized protein n=1 Tax=Colocasia esculenta TaxID=4460 RepID=A0A843WX92_COLES|nr:hypothetical protein [Colocasia esculenta]